MQSKINNTVQQLYLTTERLKELKQELKFLKITKEPEIAKNIQIARQLSASIEENADFDLFIEEQNNVHKRIAEIEYLISKSKLIKHEKKKNEVTLGSTVMVEVEGRIDSFTIVGAQDVDLNKGRISNESPVGKTLLGSKKGDEVLVETEVYSTIYRILNVSF
ncbi:GreA/GreB family elongation factor [Patescibacteria group bacterium]|nr:GreA/GreB family elongation factor [Patescibacteria group bacterium]